MMPAGLIKDLLKMVIGYIDKVDIDVTDEIDRLLGKDALKSMREMNSEIIHFEASYPEKFLTRFATSMGKKMVVHPKSQVSPQFLKDYCDPLTIVKHHRSTEDMIQSIIDSPMIASAHIKPTLEEKQDASFDFIIRNRSKLGEDVTREWVNRCASITESELKWCEESKTPIRMFTWSFNYTNHPNLPIALLIDYYKQGGSMFRLSINPRCKEILLGSEELMRKFIQFARDPNNPHPSCKYLGLWFFQLHPEELDDERIVRYRDVYEQSSEIIPLFRQRRHLFRNWNTIIANPNADDETIDEAFEEARLRKATRPEVDWRAACNDYFRCATITQEVLDRCKELGVEINWGILSMNSKLSVEMILAHKDKLSMTSVLTHSTNLPRHLMQLALGGAIAPPRPPLCVVRGDD